MAADQHDGWDAASCIGVTATEAAAARAVAGRRSTAIINDPYAEPLVRAVGVDFFTELVDQCSAQDESGFALPHMVDWVAVRTRFFDDYFIAAQHAGICQSVILGAGLDSRAYRLPWSAQTILYEIDQPGVMEFKTTTLAQLEAQPLAARRSVAIDLRDDWVVSLLQAGFDVTAPTAWCAEGLLPYLGSADQDRLLDNVSALSTGSSWFAADTVDDMNRLAARIAGVGEAEEVTPHYDLSEIKTDGTRTSSELAARLRVHGWGAMCFAAPSLFDMHETATAAEDIELYQDIAFVTAFSDPSTLARDIAWGI